MTCTPSNRFFQISKKQAEGVVTKAFRSKLSELNNFIRPAQSNSNLIKQINQVNKQWTHSISETLSKHYEERLETLKKQLEALQFSTYNLEQAKSVALRWARKNFRSKLQNETILAFQSILNTFRQQKSPSHQNSSNSFLSAPALSPPCTSNPTAIPSTPLTSSSSPPNCSSTSSNPTLTPVSSKSNSISQTLPTASTVDSPSCTSSNKSNPVSSATPLNSASSNLTSTPVSSEPNTVPKSLPTTRTIHSPSYAAVLSGQNLQLTQVSDKIIRFKGAHDPLSNFFPFNLQINGVIWPSVEHRYQYDKAIFFDQLELAEEILNAPHALHAKKLSKTLPKSHSWDKHKLSVMKDLLYLKAEQCQPFRSKLLRSGKSKLSHPVSDSFWGAGKDGKGQEHMANLLTELRSKIQTNALPQPQTPKRSSPSNSSFLRSSSFPSPDKEVAFKIKPNIHQNTNNKNKVWCLPEIREKILVLGDSNLARITESPLPNIQIESYPGAKFHNILSVLGRAKNQTSLKIPEHVILSVGINNRTQNIFNTTIPNLKSLLAKAHRVFPNSKIHIAQVNYSQNLPREECCHLSLINDFLEKHSGNMAVLPKISTQALKVVTGDPVHYTSNTANTILRHWMAHLN